MTLLFIVLLASAVAWGQEVCPESGPTLTDSEWLRAASLDLRGVVPSPAEVRRLRDGDSREELVDEWLSSEAFVERVVRHHRSLLWPNVSDVRLMSNRQRLIQYSDIYYRYLVAPNYRGGPVYCGDFEAEYDSDGALVTHVDEEGYVREGWVWVDPYWDPGTPVKVCAFEANEAEVSPWGTACDGIESRYDPNCGCGPNLAWCDTRPLGHVQSYGVQAPVHAAIAGDVERRVAHTIASDASYLELLTGRTAFVNGPLVHFLRYQRNLPAHVRFNEIPVDPDLLPDLAYTDVESWLPVELGAENSGILTSTLYLMKFQTNRSRANRFYNAFLCQPFEPPDGGILLVDDPSPTADLTKRAGCQYCHALLEPAAAHWGRWGQYGAGYLPPDSFPPYDESCAWCATSGEECSTECEKFYVTDTLTAEEEDWLGWMLSYEFLDSQYTHHVEEGPRLLVAQAVAEGRLQECVASNTVEWLLGREVQSWDEGWIDRLAEQFASSGYSYRELVREVVLSENYRSVR